MKRVRLVELKKRKSNATNKENMPVLALSLLNTGHHSTLRFFFKVIKERALLNSLALADTQLEIRESVLHCMGIVLHYHCPQ